MEVKVEVIGKERSGWESFESEGLRRERDRGKRTERRAPRSASHEEGSEEEDGAAAVLVCGTSGRRRT